MELPDHQRRQIGRDQVYKQPRKPLFHRFANAVRDRAFFAHTRQQQHIFVVFLVQHVHRVINGDDTNQLIIRIHHRAGNHVILIEEIGNIGLFFGCLHGAKAVFQNIAQARITFR